MAAFPHFLGGCALSFCLGGLVVCTPAVAHAAEQKTPTTLFRNGTEGYQAFRIPAIVKTADGQLLAFCEARQGGDASEIDLVLKRSVDSGRSWQDLEVVQESDSFQHLFDSTNTAITVGNPAPVVDLLDPQHPGRIWLPFTLENDRVFVTYSDDHGHSWSAPREITADVKLEPWGWIATGPVHSIQLQHGPHRGRLVVPADHRLGDDGADRGLEGAQVMLSDDHGMTWRLGAIDATYDDDLKANETTVVELNDGRLLFNTRDQNGLAPGNRGTAFSSDGGQSFDSSGSDKYQWFQPDPAPFDPPVVQCALLRAASRSAGDDRNLILFSGPDESGPSGPGRSDLRLRYTTDEARTWRDGPLIHEGPAAYSDMVRLAGNEVGILFEAGTAGQKSYDRIDFVVFDTSALSTLDDAADQAASPATNAPATSNGNVVIGPEYALDPDLTDRGNRKGRLFEFSMRLADSAIFDGQDQTLDPQKPVREQRKIFVYVPAQYQDGTRAPLLVTHDGPSNLDLVRNALDNLTISPNPQRRLPAFIVIAVQNGGNDGKGSERGLEYDTMSDRLARFIQAEVLPAVLDNAEIRAAYPHLAFTDDPWGRAVMGCSSGGAAALTMGWFRPDLFRRLITYSGTFVDQQDDDAPEEATYPLGAWEYHSGLKLIESSEKKPLRIFTHVSENDLRATDPEETYHNWVMANERTAAALESKGYDYRYVFSRATRHCDRKVFEATLADTLVWMWQDYQPETASKSTK